MSTSRRTRYSDYLWFTITLAISLLCGMTVPLDSCTHDIGILLAVFYFIAELGILAILLALILPLTDDEQDFIGRTGVYTCFTSSFASICNLILMLDVHAKCRNQLATHIMALYWIAVLFSLCMLVGVIVFLILLCRWDSVIKRMIKRMIDKKRRNDKHKAIIRSMSGDIMRSQRLSISTLSQYISFTRGDIIMPHDFDRMPHEFDRMPHEFDRMPHEFDRMPHEFDRMPHAFDRMQHEFDRMPHEFDRMPHAFDRMPHEFDRMPHEFASHATVIYALFTDISHISDAHTCSICSHAIIGGHRVSKAIVGRPCHTSCLMAMLTAVYHDSDMDKVESFLETLIVKIQKYAQDGGVNAIET